ncbi:hypothetical protein JTB14_035728 [Gonioctena quinquepunctata]|nr:hypothetical protein JTB14_035728 [Gonioctena quinquepunctata]
MSVDFDVIRRASLLSVISERKDESISYRDKVKAAPKDKYYLCHLLFFMMGFLVIMPLIFFGTAANYWMFKFRNTTDDSNKAENRTSLQTLYQSVTMVAQCVPSVICTIAAASYSQKFNARAGSLVSLFVMLLIFLINTAFTKINTDSWQTGFFVMTMLLLGVNCGALAHYQIFSMVIMAKFPKNFMKMFLLGQGGGIISDIMQVISISLTDSDEVGASIYFAAGTILICATITLYFVIRHTDIYEYYDNDGDATPEDQNSFVSNWSDMKEVSKFIWPVLLIVAVMMCTMAAIHPSVTSLVVSQNRDSEGAWEKKYFTPVLAFLLGDISSLIGRIVARGAITESNYVFWIIGVVARGFVSIAVIMLCNAKPRNLPVVFDKDWQYILFIIIYQWSGGFIMNLAFLSLNGLSRGKPEIGLKLISITLAVTAALFSANGIIVVKLL